MREIGAIPCSLRLEYAQTDPLAGPCEHRIQIRIFDLRLGKLYIETIDLLRATNEPCTLATGTATKVSPAFHNRPANQDITASCCIDSFRRPDMAVRRIVPSLELRRAASATSTTQVSSIVLTQAFG